MESQELADTFHISDVSLMNPKDTYR